jgi:hypothetical protein
MAHNLAREEPSTISAQQCRSYSADCETHGRDMALSIQRVQSDRIFVVSGSPPEARGFLRRRPEENA